MSTKKLINSLRRLHIEVYLENLAIEDHNKEFFSLRFFLIQLKKSFKFFKIPEERFVCNIHNRNFYHERKNDEAPYIIVTLSLDDRRLVPIHITRDILRNHIDDLHEYVRLEILDCLMENPNY